MSYQITLNIAEDSEAGRLIEDVVAREQLSHEEAALKLILGTDRPRQATPAARRIIGIFNAPEDAKIMDEAMELIMEERERRNSTPPHG